MVSIQTLITLGLAIIYRYSGPEVIAASEPWVVTFFAIGFLSIGLLHGSADLYLLRLLERSGQRNSAGVHPLGRAILMYMSLMLLVAVLFWFQPFFSLIVFIVLSAYHFGESQFWITSGPRKELLPPAPLNREMFALRFTWGLWVLLSPILIHWEQTLAILHSLGLRANSPFLAFTLPGAAAGNLRIWGPAGIALLVGVILIWLHRAHAVFSKAALARELLILAVLHWTFLSTSLLISFGAYFIIWHSPISLRDQILGIQTYEPDPGFKILDYIRRAWPYWLASIIGLLTLMLAAHKQLIPGTLVSWIFAGAMILTPPHLITLSLFRRRGLSA